MISALLLKYGIPAWLAELVAGAGLVLALWAGLAWHDHNVFQRGVAQESARRDVIDRANAAKALAERARLNVLVAAAQAELDAARLDVAKLKQELDHEQAISSDRQRRLLAGTERERVLIRAIPADPGKVRQDQGTGTGAVDPAGGAASATLDPRVASDLEWVRQTRNDALTGLQGCITRYDALKKAVDSAP